MGHRRGEKINWKRLQCVKRSIFEVRVLNCSRRCQIPKYLHFHLFEWIRGGHTFLWPIGRSVNHQLILLILSTGHHISRFDRLNSFGEWPNQRALEFSATRFLCKLWWWWYDDHHHRWVSWLLPLIFFKIFISKLFETSKRQVRSFTRPRLLSRDRRVVAVQRNWNDKLQR